MVEYTPKHNQNEVSQLLEADSSSFSGQLNLVNKEASMPDNDAVFSSNQNEELLWVDDYKCSQCGIELPPSFVEERQEHTDFHLAERLQKEESGTESRILKLSQRCGFNADVSNFGLSPSTYIKLFEIKGVWVEC